MLWRVHFQILLFLFLEPGHLSAKSDVYSFGVVLLEILSGKKAIDKNRPRGEHNLVDWAKPYLTNKRRVFRVLDSRLEGQYTLDHAAKVADLARQCLCMDPRIRPNMDEVIATLELLQESNDTSRKDRNAHSLNQRRANVQPVSCKSTSERTRMVTNYPRPLASPLRV